MIPQPSVVCAGILVADLFVPPLARLPVAGELLSTDDFLLRPGGCAANTTVSLARLGVQASVVGKVGRDIFGDFVEQRLREQGIATDAITRSAHSPTSKTVILPVAGEDRRYIHTIGANADLAVSDIDQSLTLQTRVFALGGYLVLPKMEQSEVAALFRAMRSKGIRTILDVVVPTNGDRPNLDAVRQILPHVDVFMPNDHEAEILTGAADAKRRRKSSFTRGARSRSSRKAVRARCS